jgi:dipeptidyl aminopeptidase/acylaminoacyl peptidase
MLSRQRSTIPALSMFIGCNHVQSPTAAGVAPTPLELGRPSPPFGAWPSPITSAVATEDETLITAATFTGDSVLWLEARPDGRTVLLEHSTGADTEPLPAGTSVYTEAHTYGGGAYAATESLIVYVNEADKRLYRLDRGANSPPRALTPPAETYFADCVVDERRARALCIQDDRSPKLPVDSIVSVGLDADRPPRVLVSGHDFFAAPRLSPDGKHLAWISWDHPQMPWDGTDLWVASIGDDGRLGRPSHVAGGPTESVLQPLWSPDGVLHFLSDRSGYWNLYQQGSGGVEALAPMDADVSDAPWELGESSYAFAAGERIVFTATKNESTKLAILDRNTRSVRRLELPYEAIGGELATALHVRGDHALMIAGSATMAFSLIDVDLATSGSSVLASGSSTVDPRYLPTPEPISFPTSQGATAYALYWPPTNADVLAPTNERPPLLVRSHGGPTSYVYPVLNPWVPYWTSRGFAVVDVNYGGSTGHGRAYRKRLDGQWGVVDVEDCIAAAQFLVQRGDVDGSRLLIHGGSAGGYTTLAALAFRDGVFRAGASWFGISDLERLFHETQASDKLESHYEETLLGPYPKTQKLWHDRSPVHSADKLTAPVIFFQGAEDPIVPPSQSKIMHAALVERGIPTAYLEFEGEGHGFRKAENNQRALDAELYFFRRVLEIPLPDPVAPRPIVIDVLDPPTPTE